MRPARRAVIDVGTNSCKLLVADISEAQVEPVLEQSHQTRLGQGFYQAHQLQPGPIARTAGAVAELAAKARELQAQSIRVIGTSAAREAVNGQELMAAVRQASGLELEIITGDKEADWAFRGATTDIALTQQPVLLLDVGGGSTEFIAGQGTNKVFSESYALGTVRLIERFPPGDPPHREELARGRAWVEWFLATHVRPSLLGALKQLASESSKSRRVPPGAVQLVGTGGTASILGCMEAQLDRFDRAKLEATRLTLERVRWHTEHLWGLPLEQRKQVPGLPANRADVILAGVVIYEQVMRVFGFAELRISTRGLRFAAVMEPA